MNKIWLIARREYLYNFRRRSFLFAAFGVPVFTIVMMFVVFSITDDAFTATGQLGNIGYVDLAGVLADPLDKPDEYVAYDSVDAAHRALLADEIGAYFVLDGGYLQTGSVDLFALDRTPGGVEDQFNTFFTTNLARLVPDDLPVARIVEPMDVQIVDLSTGAALDSNDALLARIMTPFILAFVFMMAVNTTSQFLMSGVVEEKENRMMEVLITSCRPLEMLWGKVLGLGALGLTQVGLWVAAGMLIIRLQPENPLIQGFSVSTDFLLISIVYLLLGYFLVGAAMAGVGAAVTAEQEGRQFAGVLTLIFVLPFIAFVAFMQDPNGALPVFLSLFPLTSPISMIMRMPLTVVPAWQIVLSLVLLAAAVVLVVWLAAVVFRIGLLMYGKRLSLQALLGAVRQGRRTMLTTAGEGN